ILALQLNAEPWCGEERSIHANPAQQERVLRCRLESSRANALEPHAVFPAKPEPPGQIRIDMVRKTPARRGLRRTCTLRARIRHKQNHETQTERQHSNLVFQLVLLPDLYGKRRTFGKISSTSWRRWL